MSMVTDTLQLQGVAFEVLRHPRAMTALGEAIALGIPADEVVKTVLIDTGDGRHIMCALPATRRIDMRLVKDAIGDSDCHLASEYEMEADYPEFELGALPPIGALAHAPVLVDAEVMEHASVVFAGGTQTDSVRCRTQELFARADVRVLDLTREPDAGLWIH